MVCPYGMFTVISVSPNRNAAFLNKKQTNPSHYGSDLSIVRLVSILDFRINLISTINLFKNKHNDNLTG